MANNKHPKCAAGIQNRQVVTLNRELQASHGKLGKLWLAAEDGGYHVHPPPPPCSLSVPCLPFSVRSIGQVSGQIQCDGLGWGSELGQDMGSDWSR